MNVLMDWEREARTGLIEAVYAQGKSLACLSSLIETTAAEQKRLLITRLSPEAFASLPPFLIAQLDYDPLSRTAILGKVETPAKAKIVVVSAGMADMPVAQEAVRTLAFSGVAADMICDVGVAGLWRLMARLDDIRSYVVVMAVAGMEGALFSVLGGLIHAPLIAVPTSTGYGVTALGKIALKSALGSCAPGLLTVNIDNGFGAAQSALRILNVLKKAPALVCEG